MTSIRNLAHIIVVAIWMMVFHSCNVHYKGDHMVAYGVNMGIPIEEYVENLQQRDSTWRVVEGLRYSEEDSCYIITVMHTPQNIHYSINNDSITELVTLDIKGTRNTKTVYLIETTINFFFTRSNRLEFVSDYVLIEGYYGIVYGLSMIFEEYPNDFEYTTRYKTKDNEVFIINNARACRGKESYILSDNEYSAYWHWNCGECFVKLEEWGTTKVLYIDSKSVAVFDKENLH